MTTEQRAIVPGVGVGKVTLGAKRAEVEAILGTPSVYAEGHIVILTYAALCLEVTLYKGKVMTVEVKGDAAASTATEHGLRVGSTEQDVVAALGPPASTTPGAIKIIAYPHGIRFSLNGDVVYAITVGEADEPVAPKPTKATAKKSASGGKKKAVEEMGLDWFNERYENVNSRAFEKVWRSEGNLELSEKALAKILNYETEAALVVEGDLSVDGHLSVDDHHAVHVTGTVRCRSLRVGAGVLQCDGLEIAQWLEFACDDTQRMETFDPGPIKAPVIYCPHVDVDALASRVLHEFTCNDVQEEGAALRKLLTTKFDRLYGALKHGDVVDDEWVRANS